MARERLGVHWRNDVVVDVDAVRLGRPLGFRWPGGKARSDRGHAATNKVSPADDMPSRCRVRLAADTARKELTSSEHGIDSSVGLHLTILRMPAVRSSGMLRALRYRFAGA